MSEIPVLKTLGVTDFVSEIKHVENYPDFEKIVASNCLHGLPRVILKNNKHESTEAKNLSHIL